MLTPPLAPILARPAESLPPANPQWIFQWKLDGYRTISFLRGGRLHLQSRRGADLTPSFPDLARAARQVPVSCVIDAELVVPAAGRLDFRALQHRARLRGRSAAAAASTHPAHLIVFDLLELEGHGELLRRPYAERWALLSELFAAEVLTAPFELVPATTDRATALSWLTPAYGDAGVEGCLVKRLSSAYRPGERSGAWLKVRTRSGAEAIVGGITGPLAAPHTLMLARHDAAGRLRLVGRTTLLPAAARAELADLITPAGPDHPWIGVTFSSPWSSSAPLRVTPVQPDLVVEILADTSADAGRHRHPVRYVRPRLDLAPDDVEPLEDQ